MCVCVCVCVCEFALVLDLFGFLSHKTFHIAL